MADIEANLDAATSATGQAVAATANEIARVESIAESAIENAEARVDAAEELAQQLADAALQSEIGKQVSLLGEDFDKWRSELEQVKMQATLQETLLTEAVSRISAAELLLASLSQPIPLAPLPTTPTLAAETGVETIQAASPLQAENDASTENEIPLQVRRKKKFV